MRAVLVLVLPLVAWSSPLPDKPVGLGGFRPVIGGRGAGPSTGFSKAVVSHAPAPVHAPLHVPSPPIHQAAPPVYQQQVHQSARQPDKTIYVDVPSHAPAPPLPPKAAGPPRKHYKIVFIRAPPPPPRTQAILPPRTESKTVIYVLHQRQEDDQQKVIQVPHVPHDPEVFFVEYDKPPTAHDLQRLSSGNLDGFSVTSHQAGAAGQYGTPVVQQDQLYQGDNVFKRQVEETAAKAAGEEEVPAPTNT